jgi:hypothetical protein
MAVSLPHRLSLALAASAAATALAAAPALATEGPNAPPPAAQLPSGVGPVSFSPAPAATAPAATKARRVISRARLRPHSVRRGKHARLKISLASPSRLRVVMRRKASGHLIRAKNVPASDRNVTVRLPARSNGHALRTGRYRIRIMSVDAQGNRSAPIVHTLKVR